MSYFEAWTAHLWPLIREDYQRLLREKPAPRNDPPTGCEYKGFLKTLKSQVQGEVRTVTCNLTWVDPSENTCLQQDISLQMVANFVQDTFLAPLPPPQDDADTPAVAAKVPLVGSARNRASIVAIVAASSPDVMVLGVTIVTHLALSRL